MGAREVTLKDTGKIDKPPTTKNVNDVYNSWDILHYINIWYPKPLIPCSQQDLITTALTLNEIVFIATASMWPGFQETGDVGPSS